MTKALPILICVLLWAASTQAYPQFQLSTGASRCSQCHYAPAGGGLINAFGRYAAEEEISRGGDGDFLHGAWEPPEWLRLGGDFRQAVLIRDQATAAEVEVLAFPMQMDLYGRVEFSKLSINATVGARGAARPRDLELGERFLSREHYVMWQPRRSGWYARAGRYYVPYGLRVVEHIGYVRRDLGFNLLEETLTASLGNLNNESEWHLSLFAPSPYWSAGDSGYGGSFLYERRNEDTDFAWGAQALFARNETGFRGQAGAFAKSWLASPKLLFMGEFNMTGRYFDDDGLMDLGWVSYLSSSWLPITGIMGSLVWETQQREVSSVTRHAVGAQLQYFPAAHFEIAALLRTQLAHEQPELPLGTLALLQLHYYL